MKKSFLFKRMPFEIDAEPKIVNSTEGYKEISHVRIIKKYKTKSISMLLFNIMMLGVLIIGSLKICFSGPLDLIGIIGTMVFLPIIIICLVNIIFHLTGPDKEIIYDRLNGTVTLPNVLWGKPVKINFTEMEAVLSLAGLKAPGLILAARYPRKKFSDHFKPSILLGLDPFKTWAFIVSYMDKNRPLLPGEVFDPYREADEKRRAEEGYPPPLYPLKFNR